MEQVDRNNASQVGSLHLVDLEESENWQRCSPRHVTQEQLERFAGYAGEIFEAFGMDMNTPGTLATPRRFIQALFDATEGYEGDPKLVTAFPTECGEGLECGSSQVIEGPIPYHALCEHHVFPFFGRAYVGYIADKNIIGISKLTRLVRLFARRFTVQERVGVQIADTLERVLDAHGVAVYLDGVHLCTQMRGVRESETMTHATFWRGEYQKDAALRAEFLSVAQHNGR